MRWNNQLSLVRPLADIGPGFALAKRGCKITQY
jgi:hypothetical protein